VLLMNNAQQNTGAVIEAEIVHDSQGQTRRKFLAAHPPPGEPTAIIDNDEMLRRIPVCLATLQNWRKTGKIPYIQGPGRRVLYHWPTVEQALVRMQRGGGQ
jgi:hypothetical protein